MKKNAAGLTNEVRAGLSQLTRRCERDVCRLKPVPIFSSTDEDTLG